jgi:hypothetical protein
MKLGDLLCALGTAYSSPLRVTTDDPSPVDAASRSPSTAHQPPSFSNAFLAPLWLALAALRNQYRA